MGFEDDLEQAKRASTAHLLLRCARLVNEHAIASLPTGPDAERPRASHLALFPHIELDGGTRVTELATKLGITKQGVGQLVDDLEGMGMVERRPDPDDGRAKRVCFTEHGKAAMLHGLSHLASVDEDLLKILGERKMTGLRRALLALYDHFESAEG